MRVAVIPPVAPRNPWQRRLYEALAEHGVVVTGGEMKPWWPRRVTGEVDLVHLHWLESLMVSSGDRFAPARTLAAAGSIELTLRELRWHRVPVAWTLHNVEPHSSPAPAVHRWLNGRAAKLVDVMIVHSEYAARWARTRLHPLCAIVVAQHPHYIGAYLEGALSSVQVRARYGIPLNSTLFLSFGTAQSYKRIPDALASFARLRDDNARMLVIGHPDDGADTPMLRKYAAADPRVTLDLRPADDDEVLALFSAADFTVINYEAFSSGVLLLALSCGCPVIAPSTGVSSETARPPAVRTFSDGHLTEALAAAIAQKSGCARAAARRAAEQYPPERQAGEYLRAYEIARRAAAAR